MSDARIEAFLAAARSGLASADELGYAPAPAPVAGLARPQRPTAMLDQFGLAVAAQPASRHDALEPADQMPGSPGSELAATTPADSSPISPIRQAPLVHGSPSFDAGGSSSSSPDLPRELALTGWSRSASQR